MKYDGITSGIMAVANHKLTTESIEAYKEYLDQKWLKVETIEKDYISKEELKAYIMGASWDTSGKGDALLEINLIIKKLNL